MNTKTNRSQAATKDTFLSIGHAIRINITKSTTHKIAAFIWNANLIVTNREPTAEGLRHGNTRSTAEGHATAGLTAIDKVKDCEHKAKGLKGETKTKGGQLWTYEQNEPDRHH